MEAWKKGWYGNWVGNFAFLLYDDLLIVSSHEKKSPHLCSVSYIFSLYLSCFPHLFKTIISLLSPATDFEIDNYYPRGFPFQSPGCTATHIKSIDYLVGQNQFYFHQQGRAFFSIPPTSANLSVRLNTPSNTPCPEHRPASINL